jgi:hypothetical protein
MLKFLPILPLVLVGCSAVGVDTTRETQTLPDGTVVVTEWKRIGGQSLLTDRTIHKFRFETGLDGKGILTAEGYSSQETKALELLQSIMDLLAQAAKKVP